MTWVRADEMVPPVAPTLFRFVPEAVVISDESVRQDIHKIVVYLT